MPPPAVQQLWEREGALLAFGVIPCLTALGVLSLVALSSQLCQGLCLQLVQADVGGAWWHKCKQSPC